MLKDAATAAEVTESATRSFSLLLCDSFRFAVITDARDMAHAVRT